MYIYCTFYARKIIYERLSGLFFWEETYYAKIVGSETLKQLINVAFQGKFSC